MGRLVNWANRVDSMHCVDMTHDRRTYSHQSLDYILCVCVCRHVEQKAVRLIDLRYSFFGCRCCCSSPIIEKVLSALYLYFFFSVRKFLDRRTNFTAQMRSTTNQRLPSRPRIESWESRSASESCDERQIQGDKWQRPFRV